MDQSDIAFFKALLLKKREEIIALQEARHQAQSPVELDQSRVGRLSRMDALQQQAMAQANQRKAELMLKKIEAALRRCEDGSFGDCSECEEPIARQRLEIEPTTLKCIRCAQRAEKRVHSPQS